MGWKSGFVLGLIAFVLVLVCLFGAWFTVHMEGSAMGTTMEVDVAYGLGGAYVDMEMMGMNMGMGMSYSELPPSSEVDEMIAVFTTTQLLVIPAVIFTLLFFIFAIMIGLGKMGGGIAVVLGVLGMIFTLIAFIYFMVAIPPTMAQQTTVPGVTGSFAMEGFWGSESLDLDLGLGSINADVSWGPGLAWYLMIVAFVMILIATVMMIGARPKPKPTVAYTPAVYSMPPTSLQTETPPEPDARSPFE